MLQGGSLPRNTMPCSLQFVIPYRQFCLLWMLPCGSEWLPTTFHRKALLLFTTSSQKEGCHLLHICTGCFFHFATCECILALVFILLFNKYYTKSVVLFLPSLFLFLWKKFRFKPTICDIELIHFLSDCLIYSNFASSCVRHFDK